MNIDEALTVAANYPPTQENQTPPWHNEAALWAVLTALAELAEYVREHRPVMPLAQRGRTVDHAVEVFRSPDGGAVLASLCGGLAPDYIENADLDLTALDVFDPTHDDACKTCCRRLPKEIRPPVPARPHRTRHPDTLAGFEVWPELDGAAVLLMEVIPDPTGHASPTIVLVEAFVPSGTLAEIVTAARAARGKVSP